MGLADVGLLLLAFLLPFVLLLVALPPFLRLLTSRGRVSVDAHKSPPSKVPEPAGPIIFAAAAAGELVAAVGFQSAVPVAILLCAAVAFVVGLWDDFYVLGGKTKPLLLLLAGVAFLLPAAFGADLYQPVINFPILGSTSSH